MRYKLTHLFIHSFTHSFIRHLQLTDLQRSQVVTSSCLLDIGVWLSTRRRHDLSVNLTLDAVEVDCKLSWSVHLVTTSQYLAIIYGIPLLLLLLLTMLLWICRRHVLDKAVDGSTLVWNSIGIIDKGVRPEGRAAGGRERAVFDCLQWQVARRLWTENLELADH